jgi:carbonic anhydrase/acetyltransferase-like protein (isoleucine patch superfamily)
MPTVFDRQQIDVTAFVAPNATIIGDVRIGAQSSVWFGCVLRADLAPIIVGAGTNIQDLTVVHVDMDQPCVIGAAVTIGHRAVIHGACIEDGALVGIGAIVLGGATVGEGALVGAGAVVTEGVVIPARHLALGVPARVVRVLSDAEVDRQRSIAASYVSNSEMFRTGSITRWLGADGPPRA